MSFTFLRQFLRCFLCYRYQVYFHVSERIGPTGKGKTDQSNLALRVSPLVLELGQGRGPCNKVEINAEMNK